MTTFLDPAQTVKDLRDAASLLSTSPWGQGTSYAPDTGAFCAFGAVRHVIGGLVVGPQYPLGYRSLDIHGEDMTVEEKARYKDLRDRASNASRAFYRVISYDMTQYNDVEGRTKDQMVRALETVAAAIEENPRRA